MSHSHSTESSISVKLLSPAVDDVQNPVRRRRKRSKDEPPMMRIVLLGKNVSENSRVGNFILGRSAFESEAPPADEEQHSERVRGKHITVINSPHLLQPNLSLRHITQGVRECVYLSDPGPHVIVLVLKHDECSREDEERVEMVLRCFSDSVFKHTMVLTTQEPDSVELPEVNDVIKDIIKNCFNRHYRLQRNSSPDELTQTLEDIVKRNDKGFLICDEYERSQCFLKEQQIKESEGVKLNLILCGSDRTLKTSISNLILDQRDETSELSSECVRREGEVCGRLISLVEFPSLVNTQLSEEEVMRQTLRCVTLCDPGVHVFLFVIPDGQLTDEDKAEMEKIQRIFSSRIKDYTMILLYQSSENSTAELHEETKSVIESRAGQHHFCCPTTQVSTLMEKLEQMVKANSESFFSRETFLDAQMEKLLKFEEMKRNIHSLETEIQPQDSSKTRNEVRIVLLGKTGVGKSATANTILGRKAFKAQTSQKSITKECQRESAEISGRHITVIDTPGLFDTELSAEEIQREITNCISMILPGPHVFIIVLNVGRFTPEEAKSVKIIQQTFGENSLMFTMVLFTRGDDLEDITIEQCLGNSESPMMNLIDQCGNRYHVFNNKTTDRTQVSDLLVKIDAMVTANGGSFYSCKMFRQMEREIQEKEKKNLMERVEELSREKEELIREKEELLIKQEEERERMKMMVEEEKQNQDKERKRGEQEYKKEMKDREEQDRKMQEEMKREQEMLINEMKRQKEEIKKEKEMIQSKYDTEMNRIMNTLENEREKLQDRKMREAEYQEREEEYKREIKEMREEMKRERETLKNDIEEMRRETQKIKTDKEKLQTRYDTETERLRNTAENERQNHEKERKRREEEFRQREEQYKTEIKEKEEREREIREDEKRERDSLQNDIEKMKQKQEKIKTEKDKYDTEIKRLMKTLENERQNHEKERKRREEEYKREINREREEWKKQKQEEKQRREEDEKRREREKQISDEEHQRLGSEMEGIIREKERIEREKLQQQEEDEKRVKEERNMREEQQKTSEEKLKLTEEKSEEELKRRRAEWKEEHEREKEEDIRFWSETDDSVTVKVYNKLQTEYSRWSWTLQKAMLETENKLHNKIENKTIHEFEETDLQEELQEKSEEVKKSMSDFFEKDTDASILIQWKTSFEIKIKELQENIVRETNRKLNEILQQREMKKEIDAQRTHHENTLYEKSKELALKLKDKTNDEETLKREFDSFWEQHVKKIISDTQPVKDIDILRDVRKILSDVYKSAAVDTSSESRNIYTKHSYLEYVQLKRSSGFTAPVRNIFRSAKEMFGHVLSEDDEAQIRTLITDIDQQTHRMIMSYNISKMGYNISYIQDLTGYIKTRVTEHEEGSVKYLFKNEFFIDLVYSIFIRANKTFTDQHRMFREANDPVHYIKRKRGEYYSIFQKYCQGATSAVILGEIICQKLKEPLQQSVYKNTARDLADEMRTNCPSLNGNRSNLEKHILKTLAEKEDFTSYMNYIKHPRDHFKSFIRDEVSQYISDKFSVRVQPKMRENIKLLQQKIMTAAHESTEDVKVKSGDADLWLKSFTQQLSDVLIFSEKDLSGVNHEDVDDFSLLEDVIRKELPSVISDISSKFSTETFPVKLDYKFRPDEILIDHFCRCCWVQCPFCSAICTKTIENHPGDHSVPFHRVDGITGQHYRGTTNLSICICTSEVATNHYFYPDPSDRTVLWRDYRTAGGVYADWSITPDLSELPYWKWFVCRFQKDLEEYYNKTFQGDGEIPDEWRRYSKQDAIESLDKYI